MLGSSLGPFIMSGAALVVMLATDPNLQQWRHVIVKLIHRLTH